MLIFLLVQWAGSFLEASLTLVKILQKQQSARCWKKQVLHQMLSKSVRVRLVAGVRTQFEKVLTLRHQHQMAFDVSDIYVICKLKPLTSTISVCQHEISDCQWMPVQAFRESTRHPMTRFAVDIALRSQAGESVGIACTAMDSPVRAGVRFQLYHSEAAADADERTTRTGH